MTNLLPDRKTKLFMTLLIFLTSTVFLASGFWLEEPLLSQDNWSTIAMAVLGIYVAGRAWTDVKTRGN